MKNKSAWLIGLLVLLNVFLLGTIWFTHDKPPHPDRQEVRKFVERELQFTEEQISQYDVLIKEHQQEMRSIHQQIQPLKNELFQLIAFPEDSLKTKIISEQIAKLVIQQDLATLKHFRKVRDSICTDKQKPLLDNLLSEILAKMGRQGSPPPPPRP
ncbi:Spy/CpxP family protein refolding chaperone [Arcicella rosea]|uniref:Putative membrane protein n=1 Tax=Arcicella rosea TaxID=502909 RepID=A0A841EX08_9BACT|nr:periplasmic heavy metal sensor [Arcicella rosea]MBB6004001.1 putative membrane protein [Arcicella rosea]